MNKLRTLYYKFIICSQIKKEEFIPRDNKHPHCYIFLAADYGNLGDVAITYAQKKYLQEKFPDHNVIEVPAGKTLSYLQNIKKNIQSEDIITIVGGGNMGDMYGDLELLRLMVVKKFPKNRIILFPQTIDYSDSEEANWLKKLSQKIYSAHKNLFMCAREEVSYKAMKSLYPSVNVKLTPDIVMGLNERNEITRENIVTFCLRDDMEKKDNSIIIEELSKLCSSKDLNLQKYDTHIGGGRYTEEEKYKELEKIWSQFNKSKLIITDRLHGMIFAYITGTPAIVLPNSNFKVKECYKWIKDWQRIKFLEAGYKYNDSNLLKILDISDNKDILANRLVAELETITK